MANERVVDGIRLVHKREHTLKYDSATLLSAVVMRQLHRGRSPMLPTLPVPGGSHFVDLHC